MLNERNSTVKLQQPSTSGKNSGIPADQVTKKNTLEELILTMTHPLPQCFQPHEEIPQAQQSLASLTETFGSNSIMYRLLSEKISTNSPLHNKKSNVLPER